MHDSLQHSSGPSHHRHHRSRRGPLFPTVCFCIQGTLCFLLAALFWYIRPYLSRELNRAPLGLVVFVCVFGVVYFWIAYAVYHRRKYIFDIALVFAGLGLLNIPLGTLLSIFLLSSLMERKYDFTK